MTVYGPPGAVPRSILKLLSLVVLSVHVSCSVVALIGATRRPVGAGSGVVALPVTAVESPATLYAVTLKVNSVPSPTEVSEYAAAPVGTVAI